MKLISKFMNLKLKANKIDSEKYLGNRKNKLEIYEKESKELFYNPFNFSHTDFGRLILISIDDHPEIKTVEFVV